MTFIELRETHLLRMMRYFFDKSKFLIFTIPFLLKLQWKWIRGAGVSSTAMWMCCCCNWIFKIVWNNDLDLEMKHDQVHIKNGQMFLTPKNCSFLGGRVERLIAQHEAYLNAPEKIVWLTALSQNEKKSILLCFLIFLYIIFVVFRKPKLG